jgi:predicted ATPase
MRTTRVFLRDVSVVSPMALLLFGGELQVWLPIYALVTSYNYNAKVHVAPPPAKIATSPQTRDEFYKDMRPRRMRKHVYI